MSYFCRAAAVRIVVSDVSEQITTHRAGAAGWSIFAIAQWRLERNYLPTCWFPLHLSWNKCCKHQTTGSWGVYIQCVWVNVSYVYEYIFFVACMYIKCVQSVCEPTLVHKNTRNHKTKSLHFYVNGIVGRSLFLYVYVGSSLPAHMTLLEASGSRTASYSPALGKKKCHYNTVAYLAAASLPRCVKGLFPKDTSHSAALLK